LKPVEGWRKKKVSIPASGLEAKTNESARPCLSVADGCPCPAVCSFGGGVEGDEIAVNPTACACKKGTSRRHETPFRAQAFSRNVNCLAPEMPWLLAGSEPRVTGCSAGSSGSRQPLVGSGHPAGRPRRSCNGFSADRCPPLSDFVRKATIAYPIANGNAAIFRSLLAKTSPVR